MKAYPHDRPVDELAPDTRLVLDDRGVIMLITGERRFPVNVPRWRDALDAAAQMQARLVDG